MDIQLILLLLIVVIVAVVAGNIISNFIHKTDKTDLLNKTDLKEEINQIIRMYGVGTVGVRS